MSQIIVTHVDDIGVKADVNFMTTYYIQPSLSILYILPIYWTYLHVTRIYLKLRGVATIREFVIAADLPYDSSPMPLSDNAAIKTFFDAHVHNTIPKTKVDVLAAAADFADNGVSSDATLLAKFLKVTPVANDGAVPANDDMLAFHLQGAATTENNVDINNNTMVESISIEITTPDGDAPVVSSITFIPATNFEDAKTARLGTPITL